ncbi:MAG: hypothetical protein R2827_09620 [Bdellovibrionales bacterium]
MIPFAVKGTIFVVVVAISALVYIYQSRQKNERRMAIEQLKKSQKKPFFTRGNRPSIIDPLKSTESVALRSDRTRRRVVK